MKPDPNYPRWMFHRTLDPVIVHSRDEELLLGGEWSRTIGGSPPHKETPPDPEPEEETEAEPVPQDPAEPEPAQERHHKRLFARKAPLKPPPVKKHKR